MFVNSGSEANELAIRMAKQMTGSDHFVVIQHGYHGNTNATVAVSSYKFDGKGGRGAYAHIHVYLYLMYFVAYIRVKMLAKNT